MGFWGTRWINEMGFWANQVAKVDVLVGKLQIGKSGETGRLEFEGLPVDFSTELSGASIAGTLTRLDSGKTFIFNHADGGTYTLPALEQGLNFKFKVGVVPTNGNQVVASAGASGDINGGGVINGSAVLASAEDNINFIASTCKIGDYATLFCDGTQWIVEAVSLGAGGITFTT